MATYAPPAPAAPAPTRSLTGLTDSDLVAEVRRDCDRAFEQLYERYHRRIAAYIFGMVNDHGRAEDIAQDVFMSALRRMRATDRPIAFKPWVYEIAKNACIDQFRRTHRAEEVSYDVDEGLAAADYECMLTTGSAPEVAVDQKMALDHLCGAFGGLSRTHHEILVMRELEGLSYREIGERLGMSRPAVESTLFRARRRLGEEYEELVSGERCVRVQSIIEAAGAVLPGARDQRRLAAHLSHCQACRRQARRAGFDGAALSAPRGLRAKVAAFIPLPAFLRRDDVAPLATNHHVSSLAQLSAQLGTAVDPAIASWAKAAAAAISLAVAGVVGGAAVSDQGPAGRSSAPEAPLLDGAPKTTTRSGAATAFPPLNSVTVRAGSSVRVSGAGPVKSPVRGASASAPSSGAAGLLPAGELPAVPMPITSPAAPGAPAVLDAVDPARPTGSGAPAVGSPEPDLSAASEQAAAAAATTSAGASGDGAGAKTQVEGAANAAAEAAAARAAETAAGSDVGG